MLLLGQIPWGLFHLCPPITFAALGFLERIGSWLFTFSASPFYSALFTKVLWFQHKIQGWLWNVWMIFPSLWRESSLLINRHSWGWDRDGGKGARGPGIRELEFVDHFRNKWWDENVKSYCCRSKCNSYPKGIVLPLLKTVFCWNWAWNWPIDICGVPMIAWVMLTYVITFNPYHRLTLFCFSGVQSED